MEEVYQRRTLSKHQLYEELSMWETVPEEQRQQLTKKVSPCIRMGSLCKSSCKLCSYSTNR